MKNYIYANNNNKRGIIISNRKENINNKTINKNNNIFKIGKTNHFNSVGLPPILNRKIIHRKININNNNNKTYLDPISKIINYSNNRNNNNNNDNGISRYTKCDQVQCTICLERFKEGENIRRLECLHIYHINCIKNWLKNKDQCPVCKFKVK